MAGVLMAVFMSLLKNVSPVKLGWLLAAALLTEASATLQRVCLAFLHRQSLYFCSD